MSYTPPDGHAVDFDMNASLSYRLPDAHKLVAQMDENFVTISEGIGAGFEGNGYRKVSVEIADSIAFTLEKYNTLVSILIKEGLSIGFVPDATMQMSLAIAESVAASMAASPGSIFGVTITESVAIADDANALMQIKAIVNEMIGARFYFMVDGQLWSGWAMDRSTGAPTRYANLPFNSYAKIGGVYFACAADGIYQLGGDNDNGAPIDAEFTTGLIRSGSNHNKNVENMFINVRNDGNIQLFVVANRQSYVYDIDRVNTETFDGARFKLGRGLRSTVWQFKLANENGADFEIDSLYTFPLMTERHF